jgi:hypothetical protein
MRMVLSAALAELPPGLSLRCDRGRFLVARAREPLRGCASVGQDPRWGCRCRCRSRHREGACQGRCQTPHGAGGRHRSRRPCRGWIRRRCCRLGCRTGHSPGCGASWCRAFTEASLEEPDSGGKGLAIELRRREVREACSGKRVFELGKDLEWAPGGARLQVGQPKRHGQIFGADQTRELAQCGCGPRPGKRANRRRPRSPRSRAPGCLP